ncbi:MAG: DUF6760 family protein [Cyanobacteria bacterium P01_A01_bin.68]
MRKRVSSEARVSGGVTSYPSDTLHEEVAFIAYHFHWQQTDILNLDHKTRQRWVTEINKINQKIL